MVIKPFWNLFTEGFFVALEGHNASLNGYTPSHSTTRMSWVRFYWASIFIYGYTYIYI